MRIKKRSPVRIADVALSLVVGLVIGYMAHDFLASDAESSGLSVSAETSETRPSPQAKPSDRLHQVTAASKTKTKLPIPGEAGTGNVLQQESSVMYEPMLRDLHEGIPEPGPIVGLGDGDARPVDPDNAAIIAEINYEAEAYLYQSELIATLESQHNPPDWDLDEGELEDQHLHDGLLEIEDWEELEMIDDHLLTQTTVQEDSEDTLPLNEEPLLPLD